MYPLIIPAAGSGKRSGQEENKLFTRVGTVTVIEKTLHCFHGEEISRIYLVGKKEEFSIFQKILRKSVWEDKIQFVEGGKERQDSVFHALLEMEKNPPKNVMIHDGARPFLSGEIFTRIKQQIRYYPGVVTAIPLEDTIKEAENSIITKTLNRDKLFRIQTPQMFDYDILLSCHKKARKDAYVATDDAALLEKYGYSVSLVEGSKKNFKLTYPEDFEYADWLVKMDENRARV